ncbi:uncharacterized protein DMAD_05471 [Drosophila madeirensis]|uniref:Uncharacterized protein n=1 Tax=Drosophila madeirensis TaxID=30013 RepID=A0AAU9FN70_DROMD
MTLHVLSIRPDCSLVQSKGIHQCGNRQNQGLAMSSEAFIIPDNDEDQPRHQLRQQQQDEFQDHQTNES